MEADRAIQSVKRRKTMETDKAVENINNNMRREDEEVEEERAVMKKIRKIFSLADRTVSRQGIKFNCVWRNVTSRFLKFNIPFPTLQKAFEIRYGVCEKPPSTKVSTRSNNNNYHIQRTIMEEDNKNNPEIDDDAMEEILRRLPVPSLMRAKAVCKAWNMAISAAHFNFINERDDHFVTQQNHHGIAFFCAALNQWFPIDLPRIIIKQYLSHPDPTELHLCAAAGGLFLFLDPHYNPLIFNLLTKQHRFLPTRWWLNRMAVELIVHGGHEFEIIGLDWSTEVVRIYDSIRDEWKDVPAQVQPFGSHRHDWKSTLHNGIAYFTSNFGLHLGCYDIHARGEFQFKQIKGGLPPQIDYRERKSNAYSTLPSLLSCYGKLLLVGRLEQEDSKIWGGFPFIEHSLVGIWELDSKEENNESWSLISVIPRNYFEDTVKSSHGTDFMVAASIDTIWFTIKGSKNLLTFNLKYMEWSVLPGYTGDDLVDCDIQRRGICAPFKISSSFNLSPNPPEPIPIESMRHSCEKSN